MGAGPRTEGGTTVSQQSSIPTSSSPTFAERLRAAREQQEKSSRRSLTSWLRGPRAGVAPAVAMDPIDRPRQRDELVEPLRNAS